MRLAPHRTYTQRLLLNQWFVVDHAGKYHVAARRTLHYSKDLGSTYGLSDSYALSAPSSLSFSSEFEVTIVPGEKRDVEKLFEPFLKNLNSRYFDLKIEAVETITAMAPPFMEDTIITLANSRDSFAKARAIPALGRLNTTESRRILAQLVKDRVGSYSWQAIDVLAETGDRSYVPLLAELARESAWQNAAIPALGELGGRDVVPNLAQLVHYPLGPPNEPPVQQLAMRGLANTASQEAVPYLIEALRNPLVQHDAVNALEQLTHLVIFQEKSQQWLYAGDDATAEKMARRWKRWWKATGGRAKLYGPGDCRHSTGPLP
jgi:HEAT repeat protein